MASKRTTGGLLHARALLAGEEMSKHAGEGEAGLDRGWIKQDKLWMEQGHAGGFAFAAGAAALSGCNGVTPQLWNGRETILALRDSLENRGQGMGLLGTQSRNLAGSGRCAGHKEWSCQKEKPFHGLLYPAQLKLSAPGRQGANSAKAKASPTMPSLGFGGSRESHCMALASWGTASSSPSPWGPG